MRIELLLLLSLLATIVVMIACSMPRRPTPALPGTFFPPMSLTSYDPRFATSISADVSMPATILPASAELREINISPPRCYQTISPQVTCFGKVFNSAREIIGDISLRASFKTVDGALLGGQIFSLEQRRIAAGETAPYRIQVPHARMETAALEIELVSARSPAPASLELALKDARGQYLAGEKRYRFRATIENNSEREAADIRLLVTLEDEDDAIVGYRVVDLAAALPSGAARAIDLSLTVLEAGANISHHVSLQASPALESAERQP